MYGPWGEWKRLKAVIPDTETTDVQGDVIYLSVIDLRGNVLLSTLVRPSMSRRRQYCRGRR